MTGFVSGNGGAFAGITSSFSYNKRLQPVNMSASSPSQTVFSIGYDFHVGNGTSGSDNGNVWNIYNFRRVPLDKSEGAVKDKKSLAMRQHRDSRQRR
jgi:hypothetical protein